MNSIGEESMVSFLLLRQRQAAHRTIDRIHGIGKSTMRAIELLRFAGELGIIEAHIIRMMDRGYGIGLGMSARIHRPPSRRLARAICGS
jgi:hypothetical protein